MSVFMRRLCGPPAGFAARAKPCHAHAEHLWQLGGAHLMPPISRGCTAPGARHVSPNGAGCSLAAPALERGLSPPARQVSMPGTVLAWQRPPRGVQESPDPCPYSEALLPLVRARSAYMASMTAW